MVVHMLDSAFKCAQPRIALQPAATGDKGKTACEVASAQIVPQLKQPTRPRPIALQRCACRCAEAAQSVATAATSSANAAPKPVGRP